MENPSGSRGLEFYDPVEFSHQKFLNRDARSWVYRDLGKLLQSVFILNMPLRVVGTTGYTMNKVHPPPARLQVQRSPAC